MQRTVSERAAFLPNVQELFSTEAGERLIEETIFPALDEMDREELDRALSGITRCLGDSLKENDGEKPDALAGVVMNPFQDILTVHELDIAKMAFKMGMQYGLSRVYREGIYPTANVN